MGAFKTGANISRFLERRIPKEGQKWLLSLKDHPSKSTGSGLSAGLLSELRVTGVIKRTARSPRASTWGPGNDYMDVYDLLIKGRQVSVADGIPEDDLITIFEIARVALDVDMNKLSAEMEMSIEFLTNMKQLVTKQLDPVYGSHLCPECKGSIEPIYLSGDPRNKPSEWTCSGCGKSGKF